MNKAIATSKDLWVNRGDYIDALPNAEGRINRPNERKARIGELIARGLHEGWIDQSLATELAIAASENNLDRSLYLPNGSNT